VSVVSTPLKGERELVREAECVPSYTVFGLNLQSSIPIRHLRPAENDRVDVRVLSESLELPEKNSGNWYFPGGEGLYVHVPGVALFHILADRITVDHFTETTESVELYLTGSVFGALLYLRGFIPLHGCAVKTSDGVATFMGESGVGKSTLAAAFYQSGYQLFADDVTAVKLQDGRFEVWPSPHRLRLLPETLEWLGIQISGEPEVLSGKFVLDGRRNFSQTAAKLTGLNFLQRGSRSVRRLKSTEPMLELMNNLYRPEFVEALGLQEKLFTNLAHLARMPSFHYQVPRFSCPYELLNTFVGDEAKS